MKKPITFEGFDRLAMRFIKKFAFTGVIKEMLGTENFGAGIVEKQVVLDCMKDNLVAGMILLNSEYKMHPLKKHSGQYFDYGHMRFHLQYRFFIDAVKSDPEQPTPNVVCNYVEFMLLNRWKKKSGMKKIASMIVNLGEA